MLLGYDEKQANIFFMIARQKAQRPQKFVMTVKRWNREKNINRKIALLIWHGCHGYRDFDRRTIPGAAEAWEI
jgi:hypothetical protein